MKPFILFVSLVFYVSASYAQDYYWVGGTGNWSDHSSHWATSSGGSTFHTAAPSSTDNVSFDANSFTATSQVVTLDVEADCNSMDWTGATNFPSIVGNGNTLNIYGSLTLAADMTTDFDNVEFEATTTGHTITTNGTEMGSSSAVRFNGDGGEWTFQDNFDVESMYHIAGTINFNGQNIDAGSRFQTSGPSAKTINLGNSQITAVRWWMFGTNQTVNAGTSKLVVSSIYTDDTGDGPFTYHDLEFYNYGNLYNSATFNTITIPAGLNLQVQAGAVITVDNIVSEGTKNNIVTMSSFTPGSEASFNKASSSVTIEYVEMQDIHATGGASFIANNSVDNGNNTGWTINSIMPQNYYWVGGSGNWSDFASHWSISSGGSTMHTDYPSKFDDVFFDANSFSSADQTVTNDLLIAEFHDMDWSGVTNSPTLDASIGYSLEAYGSVTFDAGMTKDIHTLRFKGNENGLTFTALGSGSNSYITFDNNGTYDLLSDVSAATFSQWEGTVNYNNVTIDCSIDYELGNGTSSSATANLSSATINCRDLNVHSTAMVTVNKGTAVFNVDRTIDGHGISLYSVTMDGTGSILGSNTFDYLTINPGSTISFEQGETQTINQDLTLDGTKANPINLNSTSAGSQATISKASGTVDAIYLLLQDIAAAGGATFNATQTVDNGNNAGWNITGLTGSDYYWVGGSGNWSDFANHWATTSGGSTFETTVPGVLDNVIFDANSFSSAGEIVTIDSDEVNFNDLDASTSTQPFTISGNGKVMNVYGSVDLPSTVTVTVSTYNFLTVGTEILNFNNGPGSNYDFNFMSSGTWGLSSALAVKNLSIEAGTINTNNENVVVSQSISFLGTNNKTLSLGTSSVQTGSLTANMAENVTLNGGSSTISAGATWFLETHASNNITLNDITFLGGSSALLYDDLSVNTFTLEAGVTLTFVGDATVTTNELIAIGTEMDPITIDPQLVSTTLTFSQATGTVNADYLVMEEVTATGGAVFNAFNSINNGNVIGWIFHKDPQTIDFPALPDKVYGDPDFELVATATSGLTVTFEIVSGPATLDGTTVSLTGVGTVQVKAEQAGNIDYDPAPSVINSFEVIEADQEITFDVLPTMTYGDPDFELEATASSGLEVSYTSSDEAVATVDGNTVTILTAGTTIITAIQDGDMNHGPAADVQQALTVNKADQTISFDELPDYDIDLQSQPVELEATASSGLEVTYTVDGPAELDGNELTVTGEGTITVVASQAGDDNHNPADDVEQAFEVASDVLSVSLTDQGIQFYPNPVSSVLYFETTGDQTPSLELRSMEGKLILSVKEIQANQRIDLSRTRKGIYILILRQNQEIIGTSRLIVE